ncbi:hypothetical protein SVAN01_10195 [Stagonosporopsis vannaccii]|nr:hypothetical protein SVAN01_10195 [Stagonosporopsis vannaccii]
MSFGRNRNPVVNFVNLGSLYSLPQGLEAFSHQRIPSFLRPRSQPKPFYGGVNLGGFYKRNHPPPFVEPRSWAYLEDGSVFVARETYNHHDLQQVLRIVDHFVRNPSGEMRALQKNRTDDRQTQMVLLEHDSDGPVLGTQYLYIYGRYSSVGENVCAPSTPYAAMRLALNSTRSSPLSIASPSRDADRKTFPTLEFLTIESTVKTAYLFRGTLIDRVLQPNVHLGNGLEFTVGRFQKQKGGTPDPDKRQGQSITKSHDYSPQRVSRQEMKQTTSTQRVDAAEYQSKVAQLKEWERTLTRREMALRWKEKAWQLEQDLSETKARHEKMFLQLEKKLAKAEAKSRLQKLPRRKKADQPSKSAQQVDDVSKMSTTPQFSRTKRRKNRPGQRERRETTIFKSLHLDGIKPNNAFEASNHDGQTEEAESIFGFLNNDDTMPTHALELLRQAKAKAKP